MRRLSLEIIGAGLNTLHVRRTLARIEKGELTVSEAAMVLEAAS